ncbi:VOC family protein [Roseivirga seohaensis]|uniref:VOC family protein n=1 Tax=Roseivirga seohaensis TaxID=1914963 RepID=UPI003BACFDB9
MSDTKKSIYGTIGWFDLTVPNATEVKDFYAKVTEWKPEPVSMGDYDDYNMTVDGEPKAGVCHKRGGNSDIPSQWMMYINVRDLDKSRSECTANGGKLVTDIKSAGSMGRYCFIEDPAGAVCALFEPKEA